MWCFNPHARVGRDTLLFMFLLGSFGFNPHARVGRDCNARTGKISPRCFNPHARVGRDIRNSVKTETKEVFQSTRPCGA